MLHVIAAALDGFVSDLQTWLYVDIVQPLLFKVGLMGYDEDTAARSAAPKLVSGTLNGYGTRTQA